MAGARGWGDDAWFARAGGIITILGVYLAAPAELERLRLTGAGETARRLMETYRPIIERKFNAPTAAAVQQETNQKIGELIDKAKGGVRLMEVFILATGTLIWALGDMIKFLRPWLVTKGWPE